MFSYTWIFLNTNLALNDHHHYLDNHHHPWPTLPPQFMEGPIFSRHYLIQSYKIGTVTPFYRWGNKRSRRTKLICPRSYSSLARSCRNCICLTPNLYSVLYIPLAPTYLLGKWASFVPALTPGKWTLRKWGERKGGQCCYGKEMGFRIKSWYIFVSWDTNSSLVDTAHTWVCEYWYNRCHVTND